MTVPPVPASAAKISRDDGSFIPEWQRFFHDMRNELASVKATLAIVTGGEVQSIAVTQVDDWPLEFDAPEDGATVISVAMGYAFSVTGISTIARQGSGDVRLYVDSEGVGTFVGVSSIKNTEAQSFEVPQGAELAVVWANVSGLEKAAVTIHGTRVLATE